MIITGVIASIIGVLSAVASKRLVDFAISKDKRNTILSFVIFFVLVIVQIGIRAFLSKKTTAVSENYSNKIRLDLYNKIAKANWRDFAEVHSDDVLTRLTSDISVVTTGVIDVIPTIIMFGVQLVFAFITLFIYDKVLAVLAIVLGPLSVLFYRLFRLKLKDYHMKIQRAEGIYRAYLHECIQNISILKVFTREDQSTVRLKELQDEKAKWVLKRNSVNITASSILSVGYYIGFILSFAWGAIRLSSGLITYGTLTVFFQLVSQVQGPFVSIARSIPQLIATEGSALRLMELENIKQEKLPQQNNNINIKNAAIEFNKLAFQYKENKPVLKNITTLINPGEIVSIIGPSGEGKTTLVRLVLSLLEQNEGFIRIASDGEKYDINPSFRNILSYVPQGNTLFSGTIIDNIRIGKADATEEEVKQALIDASAYNFVSQLKDGMYSIVGERGIGLSEGQAQRLTIARALIRNAPILILDEATSALDEETELKVLNAIKNKKTRPTCLFITHRPTVYNLTDRVLRLKDGVLVEIVK